MGLSVGDLGKEGCGGDAYIVFVWCFLRPLAERIRASLSSRVFLTDTFGKY